MISLVRGLFDTANESEGAGWRTVTGEAIRARPLQISVTPQMSAETMRLEISANLTLARVSAEVRNLSLSAFGPHAEYREELLGQEPETLTVEKSAVTVNLFKGGACRTSLVSLRGSDFWGRESGIFEVEILSGGNLSAPVLGRCRIGHPEQALCNEPETLAEEDAKAATAFIEEMESLDAADDLSRTMHFIEALCALVGEQGPSENLRGDESFSRVLEGLAQSETLQCGQVAGLLAALLTVSGIPFRRVFLYRYYPAIDGVIPNGPVVVEIFDRRRDAWIMVDPSYDAWFKDAGCFLNALDVRDRLVAGKEGEITIHRGNTPLPPIGAVPVLPRGEYGDYDYWCLFNVIAFPSVSQISAEQGMNGEGIVKSTNYLVYPGARATGKWI